ncbi:MAG: hypothetical protein H8E64_02410 [Candidatus Marinimicrobia bacterium]|nr:hypothetical protein [Candidatus Neomarinimicrobiota bacterium]
MKKQTKTINTIRLLTITLLLMSISVSYAVNNAPLGSLDGKLFFGKIFWDIPLIRWVRFSDTIEFKDGMISSTLSVKSGYKPASYNTKEENGNIVFTARAAREKGDYFDWIGVFDGESLIDVKMTWTEDGETRNYVFKQK